jgi:hypothetical protein
MMTTLPLLAAAFAAQALPAPGAVQWEEVAQDSGGRYAIEPASIARDGDKVRFVVRATGAQANADGTSMAVIRYVMDCRRRTWGMSVADFYRGDTFANSREADEDEVEMRPIAADSGEERMLRRACGS